MLSRLRQVNHCYLLVSTPKGYVDFLSRGSMLSCATSSHGLEAGYRRPSIVGQ